MVIDNSGKRDYPIDMDAIRVYLMEYVQLGKGYIANNNVDFLRYDPYHQTIDHADPYTTLLFQHLKHAHLSRNMFQRRMIHYLSVQGIGVEQTCEYIDAATKAKYKDVVRCG
eukprot:421041_1